MSSRIAQDSCSWIGLVLESSRFAEHEGVLREILGSRSVLLVVRESQSTLDAIGELMGAGATSILTVAGDDHVPRLLPLVRALANLSSVERVVVLHDATSEATELFEAQGILMMRESCEVRAALRALVQKKTALLRRERAISPISLPFAG